MIFVQIPNITSVISYDYLWFLLLQCVLPKVNKNPGVSTTPEVKTTDKFGESKSQAIRWNRCDRHRRNWRAPGKLHNLWIQTNEVLKLIWYHIIIKYRYLYIYIIISILHITTYYIICRTRTGDIITAPWYLSGDLLTRQACNVRKISRSFDTYPEAGSRTNSLFPFFITYDTKCAKAINSYSIYFKWLHLTTWNSSSSIPNHYKKTFSSQDKIQLLVFSTSSNFPKQNPDLDPALPSWKRHPQGFQLRQQQSKLTRQAPLLSLRFVCGRHPRVINSDDFMGPGWGLPKMESWKAGYPKID